MQQSCCFHGAAMAAPLRHGMRRTGHVLSAQKKGGFGSSPKKESFTEYLIEERRKEARADDAAGPSPSPDSEGVAFEEAMKGMKGSRRRAKVKVQAPVVEEVYGGKPKSRESQAEQAVVSGLALLGIVILLMGIFLAGSGFLPEDVDRFAQERVYPAFSPTVVVFLAGSTLYGLFKSKQQ